MMTMMNAHEKTHIIFTFLVTSNFYQGHNNDLSVVLRRIRNCLRITIIITIINKNTNENDKSSNTNCRE